ncbi:MAG: VWA domain-containing protein, partial [Desulfovibrionaceae bacterium]|nr:VWA domain-containing protein [Desulfovibrionaceae bacterium]
LNTALHILFDTSASMRLDDAISLASKACYGVAYSLSKIQGINVGVSAFPVDNKDVKNGVLPLVKHGEPIHNHFLVEARGTTPMAEALWWVMQQMLPLQETRKIILIITDGEPDNIADTKAALLQAHNLGMETYGIGIKSDSITRLLPIQSRSVKSLTELAPAMFGLLQNALRRVLA